MLPERERQIWDLFLPSFQRRLLILDGHRELRRELARDAFSHTADYDAAIAGWMIEQDLS